MAEEAIHTGGCACGAVRFEARGEPDNVRCCHCRNCQRATGSPFFARALFGAGQVTVTGETRRYASSDALWRVSCAACGTPLLADRPEANRMGIALAAFDDPGAFAPGSHMFTAFKVPWLKLDDGLPQWPEWAGD